MFHYSCDCQTNSRFQALPIAVVDIEVNRNLGDVRMDDIYLIFPGHQLFYILLGVTMPYQENLMFIALYSHHIPHVASRLIGKGSKVQNLRVSIY